MNYTELKASRTRLSAKALVKTSLVVYAVIAVCFVITQLLERLGLNDIFHTLTALVSGLGSLLAPLPCLIMSIAGIVQAVRAHKMGAEKCNIFILIGIVGIVISLVGIGFILNLIYHYS